MKLIPLTQGQFAMVDDEDYDWLNQWKWHYSNRGYAARSEQIPGTNKQKTIQMHCVIANAPKGMEVDHCDTNRLNNCRSNLRKVTRSQNRQNSRKAPNQSSIYKGVTWAKHRNKWFAQLNSRMTGKIYLGSFTSEIEAAKAYDKAARQHYGEFARTNF